MTDVAVPVATRKDLGVTRKSAWCPGCGDYSILSAVQLLLAELGVRRETRRSYRVSAVRRASRTT